MKRKNKVKSLSVEHKNKVRGGLTIVREKGYETNLDVNIKKSKRHLKKAMLKARRSLPVMEFNDYFAWLNKQQRIYNVAIGYNSDYHQLSDFYDYSALSAAREISWAAARVSACAEQINLYLKLKEIIEVLFWSGNYEKILPVIETFEENLGPSIWLLELKVALSQWFLGLEPQKKLVEKIQGARKGGLVSFLTYFISMRNEPSQSFDRYSELVKKRINNFDDAAIAAYVDYRLLKTAIDMNGGGENIFCVEQSHSIVDVYELLIATMQCEVIGSKEYKIPGYIIRAIEEISEVNDWRLAKIRLHLGFDFDHNELDFRSATSADFLVKGDPLRAYLSLARRKMNDTFDVRNVQACALSKSILKDGRDNESKIPLRWIVGELSTIYRLNEEMEVAHHNLKRFCKNFMGFPSVCALAGLIEDVSIHPFDPIYKEKIDVMLNSRQVHAWEFANLFKNKYPYSRGTPLSKSEYLHAMQAWSTNDAFDAELSEMCVDFIEIKHAIVRKEYDRAEGLLNKIDVVSASKSISNLVRILLIKCKTARSDISSAIDLISISLVEENINPLLLPACSVIDTKAWANISPYKDKIGLSIILSLLSIQTDESNLETLSRFALEEFLTAQGVSLPSELSLESSDYSKAELVYFLRYICTHTNMAMCMALDGTHSLDNERKNICSILTSIDKENSSHYQEEIISIINKIKLEEGLRLVDSSRVHVDTQNIAKVVTKDLSADFDRYKSLVAAGIGTSADFDSILKLVLKNDSGLELALQVPKNEADDLLYEMVVKLKDEFLSNPNHGLDSYLSKRVRHNSLTGYIRSEVEQVNLITYRDESTGLYKSNEYWIGRIQGLDQDQSLLVEKCLRDFCVEFDAITNDLKTKYFRVKTQDYPSGIFDFALDARVYHVIRSVASNSDDTVFDFIQTCFAAFWALLDPCLTNARKILSIDTKHALSDCFQRLRAGLAKTIEPVQMAEISSEIGRASAGVHSKLDLTADWFNKRESTSPTQKYTLEQIVDVSVEAAKTAHKAADIRIKKSINENDIIHASNLFLIADIIWVALDNICIHAKTVKYYNVEISAKINAEKEIIQIEICNDVGEGVVEEKSSHVLSIREDIAQGRHTDALRQEGKSGFKKIAGLVSQSKNGALEFGFTGGGRFFLKVNLSFVGMNPSTRNDIKEQEDDCESIAC